LWRPVPIEREGRGILEEKWEHLRYAIRDLDALRAEPA